ncbi:MAG: single-stranded DNA-binding protein [Chlorobi bacterium]|nr:single-stranded DNA-binding protein [Chlorobiota bacterium]
MFKVILTGALGNDATVKEAGSKNAINFDIAVSLDYKDHEGNKIEKTEWVRAVIWKQEGKSTKIAEYLKKGRKVLIEGVPGSEAFKTKDGQIKASLHVTVKEIEFLN